MSAIVLPGWFIWVIVVVAIVMVCIKMAPQLKDFIDQFNSFGDRFG